MKIYAIEGLAMGRDAYVSQALRKMNLEFTSYAYNDKLKVLGDKATIVAHSFGATLAINAARWGDTVILCDGRHADKRLAMFFDTITRQIIPFKAPKGVKVISIYRRGFFLPGHPVDGGENIQVPSSVSHTEVPILAVVRAAIEEELR